MITVAHIDENSLIERKSTHYKKNTILATTYIVMDCYWKLPILVADEIHDDW